MGHLSLIVKSIARQRGLFGLWILSLSLAVSGLLIVDVFRQSLTGTLQTQGRKMLGGDLAISSRRAWRPEELSALQNMNATGVTQVTEMLAMISGGTGSRLVSVHWIDDAYPLAGDLWVEGVAPPAVQASGVALTTAPSLWIAPELITLLGIHVGEKVKLGQLEFTVQGLVRKDSSQTFRFGQMASRIYAHRRYLEGSELIQFGSTFSQSFIFLLPGPAAETKKAAEKIFTDPEIQVTTPADLEQSSFRVLVRLLDFLGLSGLVTLCLGWIGVYYLGRRWLSLESLSGGVLKCLGFSAADLLRFLLLKLVFIMLVGIVGGGVLAWMGAQAIFPLFKDSLPAEFLLVWSWSSSLLLLLVGPLFGVLLMLPSLRALSREQPLHLVQGGNSAWRTSLADLLTFSLTTALLFFVITLAQARSWKVTFIFLGALLGTVFLVSGLGMLFIKASQYLRARTSNWKIHTAFSLWDKRRSLALLMIAVSAMAGLLAQLIPTLEKTLVGELQAAQSADRPILFLFDIQEEQLQPLQAFLKEHGISLSQTAPFIRARILRVNDDDFERAKTGQWSTREEQMDARFRNRGVNLSYRAVLSPFEKVSEGKTWAEMNRNPESSEISVEKGYADRLKLKRGDRLRFDVQGFELNATVASLREVDWDSFEPNFFILFPDGVLNDAPKTWIMTIQHHAKLSAAEIQALLGGHFPSVTSVNVQETLQSAAELFTKLSAGLKIASSLCLALGIFVFLMILLFQLASSRKDRMQLKLLGVGESDLLHLNILTYGGLCLFGLCAGSLMSLGVAGLLAHYAFDAHLRIDWLQMLRVFGLSLSCAMGGMVLLGWKMNDGDSLSQITAD